MHTHNCQHAVRSRGLTATVRAWRPMGRGPKTSGWSRRA